MMPPLFRPLLAGASWSDRLIAALGALLGIGLAALVSPLVVDPAFGLPLLIAPLGASAVLLFAVPSSPLAQPWSIAGGNTVSALVGVAAAMLVPGPALACAVAVAGAIVAMSLARCLHPPGGAVALGAVLGWPSIQGLGFSYAIVPVALDSILLLGVGWTFHRLLSRHSYPHRAPAVTPAPAGILPEDVDAALAELGETFDMAREDLDALLAAAENHALARRVELAKPPRRR